MSSTRMQIASNARKRRYRKEPATTWNTLVVLIYGANQIPGEPHASTGKFPGLDEVESSLRKDFRHILTFRNRVPIPVDLNAEAFREDNPLWRAGFAPLSTAPPTSRLGSATGSCTWYANGRLRQLGYNTQDLDVLIRDAALWDEVANEYGIPMSNSPKIGAITQWDGSGGLGHVAVVERVNSDGAIVISESGYSPNGGDWDFRWRTRTISPSSVDTFIYVHTYRLAK